MKIVVEGHLAVMGEIIIQDELRRMGFETSDWQYFKEKLGGYIEAEGPEVPLGELAEHLGEALYESGYGEQLPGMGCTDYAESYEIQRVSENEYTVTLILGGCWGGGAGVNIKRIE